MTVIDDVDQLTEQLLRIHRRFIAIRYTAINKASVRENYDGCRSIRRARV